MNITLPGQYDLASQGSNNPFTDTLAKWITDLRGSTDNFGKNATWIKNLFGANSVDSTNSAVTESSGGISVNEDGSISTGDLSSLDDLGVIGLEAIAGGIPAFQRMWSSAENQKARDWETEMSNTAYQRSVADMKAAGINPILAYSQGGASTPTAGVTGSSNSGSSLGSTLSGVTNLIKTVMREDRKSDADTAKAAHTAMKVSDPNSGRTVNSVYHQYMRNIEKLKK